MIDIALNFRTGSLKPSGHLSRSNQLTSSSFLHLSFPTGYVAEGHFVSDDYLVAKAYVKGSFIMDVLGTFPLNIVMMIADPSNPYGDAQISAMQAASAAAEGGNTGMDPGRANRMLRLMRMAKLAKLARMRKLAK